MKKRQYKTILFLLISVMISGCFTTNTTFTQRPVVQENFSHEVNLTTSASNIVIPQNIGANYHISSPGIWNGLMNFNAFVGLETHRKTTLHDNRVQLVGEPRPNEYFKTTTFKLMIMPSLRLSEKYRLGIGYGINSYADAHMIIENKIVDRKASFNMQVFQLNLSKLRVDDEKRLNYWNTQLFYLHHIRPEEAHIYRLAHAVSQVSFMSTYVNEKKFNHKFISRGIFKISFGLSIGFSVQPNSYKWGEKKTAEVDSFLFPFCYSYGLIF